MKEEKFRWIKPILDGEMAIKDMAKVSPFAERTLKYWLAAYRTFGINGLENKSTKPKSHPRETSIRVKESVIELRKKTKLSALKLHWKLKKEYVHIHPRTIGKILKREGLTRKYRSRKEKIPFPARRFQVGELVEIDIKYVPKRIEGRRYYQFTAIDCASRWRYLEAYDDKSSASAMEFLRTLVRRARFKIRAIKTDNDSSFTNRYTGYFKSSNPSRPRLHAFDRLCEKMRIKHYLIDPGKPAQNGRVERSHRSDQETFYDAVEYKTFKELQLKLRLWNMHYNDLEHCGLKGRTPNEALGL